MKFHKTLMGLAALAACAAQAQTEPQKKLERVEVTGSMIKRTDRETPSVVQVITAEQIRKSGFATVEEVLRSSSAVDVSGSVGDGVGSGFVSGVNAVSMRGMGAQGTLVLINGRRLAPVGAVDINFGRGNLVSTNTIPKDAIERIEILKDGASAIYGSDAMAGVINYVLKKEYRGGELAASAGANSHGDGRKRSASGSFGFGNLATQRFNVFGGVEISRRDPVSYFEASKVGRQADRDAWLVANSAGSTQRLQDFAHSSIGSLWGNYYSVPAATPLSSTAPNDPKLYLGTLPGCPDARTVGKGVPQKQPGQLDSSPLGQCRYNPDMDTEFLAQQDRFSGSVRGNLAINEDTTAFVDLMYSRTNTVNQLTSQSFTTIVGSNNTRVLNWALPNGQILSQHAIILAPDHPDNPTRGTAKPQAVQLAYRFEDLDQRDISDLRSTRLSAGIEGVYAGWDYDAALVYSKMDNKGVRTQRLLSSRLNELIAKGGPYHFGKANDTAAIDWLTDDATNTGNSAVTAADVRASREWFEMAGGRAAVAVGVEARHESLSATPDDAFRTGDYVGLVANGTSGSRHVLGGFGELRLPVRKDLELQAALRAEHYSDFGNSTTGKLGYKWTVLPQRLMLRGTAATGYRAPSISQISNEGFFVSFHSYGTERIYDPLRCNWNASDNSKSTSKSTQPNQWRDCNLLNYTSGIPAAQQPGSLATAVTPNPNVKPEKSRSATLGFIFSPTDYLDVSLDAWYFKRNSEIRVQRGFDIMTAYIANPSANEQFLIRDSNQGTWLRDASGALIPNSGPILALLRKYGNFNYTVTSGVDYEANLRLPSNPLGQFKFKLEGSFTARYDQQILSGGTVERIDGTTTSGVPKTKASLRMDWSKNDYSAWLRLNHSDPLWSTTSSAQCLSKPTALQSYPSSQGWCTAALQTTLDMGLAYTGFKNLVLSGSILNLTNEFISRGAATVPAQFGHWDSGNRSDADLGRRFNVSLSYRWE